MSSTRVWRTTSVCACPTVVDCSDEQSRFDDRKYFIKILSSSYFTLDIPYSEHGLPLIRDVVVLTSSGECVSVMWSSVGNTVTISSNVDLNGHTIILF